MIADTLDRLPRYRGLHPNLDTVIDALGQLDLARLPDGRHEIKGDDAYLNLMRTKLGEGGAWEAHRVYIDLQLVLEHEETIAWAPLEQFDSFSGYDEARDVMFSPDTLPGSPILLKAGMFALFFPEDAHRPCIGEGQGRKAVFKIKNLPTPAKAESPLKHQGTLRLTSRRLVLRQFQQSDAQAMFDNWCSDPQVTAAIGWDPHPNAAFTANLLADWVKGYQRDSKYHWGIELDGALIGDIAVISYNERHLSAEIGYCLSRAYWNQGIMTEALMRAMRFLFAEVGFHRIVLQHLVSNSASGRVMQKAGLRQEGVQRQLMKNKMGHYEDVVLYAAIRDEWQAAHPTA